MIVILLSDRGSRPIKLPLRLLHLCHPLALPIRSVLLEAAAQAPVVSQRVAAPRRWYSFQTPMTRSYHRDLKYTIIPYSESSTLRRWCSLHTPMSRSGHHGPKYTLTLHVPVGFSILSLSGFFIGVSLLGFLYWGFFYRRAYEVLHWISCRVLIGLFDVTSGIRRCWHHPCESHKKHRRPCLTTDQ